MSKSKKPARAAAPIPKTLPKTIANALPASIDVMQTLQQLARLLPAVAKDMKKAKDSGSIPAARAFVALHRLVSRTDEELKPLSDLFNQYKTELLPALFEQDGVSSVPLDEGFRVGLSSRFVASIKPGEKDPAYEWLKKNGLGDIIQATVNSGTLSASLKSMLEERNIEPPSELFNTAFIPNVSVTATK